MVAVSYGIQWQVKVIDKFEVIPTLNTNRKSMNKVITKTNTAVVGTRMETRTEK